MRAYGLPRNNDIANPDIADIHTYGLKSSTGRLPKRSGEYKGYVGSEEKRIARRRYKKVERLSAKHDIRNMIVAGVDAD